MLRPAVRRGLLALGAIALVAVTLLGVVVASLSATPMNAPSLKPVVVKVLASQVEGGRAQVERVQIVRYPEEGAIGVRLHGVDLKDGRGRPVLHATLVEAGLGADSIFSFAPAPSRLVLKDFFVAASVSPQGGYALGYDAKGPPPPLDLETILLSLTGKARRDRPLSYIRHVELEHGVVLFREVAGPVAYKADVRKVAFDKDSDRFEGVSQLSVDEGRGVARISAAAKGEVGLDSLTASGSIANLVPARIFAAAGVARPLSVLDAPVQGQARLQYALERGIAAADVTGSAGPGQLRLGGFAQPLEGAELVSRYDPASKQVMLERFGVRAERTRLDVTGRFWLEPKAANQPARLVYRFQSPESLIGMNRLVAPQRLQDMTLAGTVVPAQRRLAVTTFRARFGGAPVRLSAVAWAPKPRVSPGLKADLTVSGPMEIAALYALWPENLAPVARQFVVPRLHSATVLGATAVADIPPGQLARKRLDNRMLRVAFRYAGGGVKVAPTLPGIENAVGEGVIQGNRLDLTMATGRLGALDISEATVTVPRFLPSGASAVVRSRARGDLGDMLRLIDSPPLHMMGAASMSPDRFSGPADLVIDIRAPLRKDVSRRDIRVAYEGELKGLRITDVTLGEDLRDGQMATKGTLDHVEARGTGRVGPFGGRIDFRMPLSGPEPGRKFIKLDGKVSIAGAQGAPFAGDINTRYGIGGAVIRSPMFNGKAEWRKGERMLAEGIGQPAAWSEAGLPAGPAMPARVPVRLSMTAATSGVWSGGLEADAYSGSLTYSRGKPRLVRYEAEITPAEAQRIGVGKLPMFARTQTVRLDAQVGHGTGSAAYQVGGLDGRFEWFPGDGAGRLGYRYDSTIDGDDLKGLGLPFSLPDPIQVSLEGVGEAGGLTGRGTAAGARLSYKISPEHDSRRELTFSGSASDAVFARLGVDVRSMMDGPLDFSGQLVRTAQGRVSGHLGGDFHRTALNIPNSGWSKPAGKAARGGLDVALADGAITLRSITADGEGVLVRGAGSIARNGVLSVDLPTARLDGFFDGSLRASRSDAGLQATVDARYLDFRPILKAAQRPAKGEGASVAPADRRVRLAADIDRVRVTDSGYVKAVKLSGGWGELGERQATLTAISEGGGAIDIRAFPKDGATALSLQVADLGDIARTLGGYDNLLGGVTTGSGRIVPGGYDFDFEIRNMTIRRVPGAAQLVADEGAIHFDRLVAPLQIRGAQVTLGDVVATGPSVGLTARGIMDTKTRTMDVVGVVTPAYGVNAALGVLLGAPEGEGLVGITYRATGAFTNPNIAINPLSAIAPGIFRRLFEPRTPQHPE